MGLTGGALVALLVVAVIAAGVQSAIGFGQALLLAPALLALTDPEAAVRCAVLVGVLINVLVLAGERRRPLVDRRQIARMGAAGLPAMAGGLLVLAALERPVLQVVAGVVVLAALVARRRATPPAAPASAATPSAAPASAAAPGPAPAPRAESSAQAADLAAGAVAGLLTTTTALNGPPIVLRLRGRPPAQVRDTTNATLLVLNLAGAALLLARSSDGAWLALALVPAILAGHRLGRLVFARLDARRYGAAATGLIAVAGAASVVAGLAG